MKTCLHAKVYVQYCYGYRVTLLHEEEDEDEESVKSCLPVFHTSCDIFIPFFAYSYFLHVLHLDVLKRQIETESENWYFLMYGYNAGPPNWQSLYTQYYCTVWLGHYLFWKLNLLMCYRIESLFAGCSLVWYVTVSCITLVWWIS